jgi:hypothetical protein
MVLVTVKITNKTGGTWDAGDSVWELPSGRRALARIDEKLAASLPLTRRWVNGEARTVTHCLQD